MNLNPIRWSADMKAISQLITLVITIIGSVGSLAAYLGSEIYKFAVAQTMMVQELRVVQNQLSDEKTAIIDENKQRTVSLTGLKTELVPRIQILENAINKAEQDASAARQRADDMKEDLRNLKDLATRNLSVTESHDADIRATRKAVTGTEGQ